MGTRVVLDTNVLVSALGWRGPSKTVVRHCLEGQLQLVLSPVILNELERVLSYPKFRFSPGEIAEYLKLLSTAAEIVEPGFKLAIIKEDPDDDRILECALAGRVEVIVSGDRHLRGLGNFGDIPIRSPREFLDDLIGR